MPVVSWIWVSIAPWSQKGQPYPRVHQAQHCHWGRERTVPLCSVLCGLTSCTGCSLGTTAQEGQQTIRGLQRWWRVRCVRSSWGLLVQPKEEETEGRYCGANTELCTLWQQQSLREQRGAVSGEGQGVLGKGSAPEGGGYGTGCPRAMGTALSWVQRVFGQCSRTLGLDFGWCVWSWELHDTSNPQSLPTWIILWP